MTHSQESEEAQFRLAEYKELKSEQRLRLTTRDGLVYGTFTALAGAAAVGLSGQQASLVLLAVPWVCWCLGRTYLRNSHKIREIGRYLTSFPVGWERHRMQVDGRGRRQALQLGVDLTVFVATGLLSVALFWGVGSGGALTVVGSAGDCLLLATLAIEFIAAYRNEVQR